jgi:hypothetical protein
MTKVLLKSRLRFLITLGFLTIGGDLAAETTGRVCIAPVGSAEYDSADCDPADHIFRVDPVSFERRFVWYETRGTEVAVGTILSQSSVVDIDALRLRKAFISVSPVEPGVAVTFVAKSSSIEGLVWKWTAVDPKLIRLVRLPRDVTSLTLSSPRHRPVNLVIQDQDLVALGRANLQRYEMLSGRIVEADTDTPLLAGRVESPDGWLLAETDSNGSFEIDIDAELASKWPTALHVRVAGHGAKVLALAEIPQPRRWNRIELLPGGGVRVQLSELTELDPSDDIILELRLHRGGAPDSWETVGRAVTKPNGTPALFLELDPGKYVLTCAGQGPLEQIARDIHVKSGVITDIDLDIRPVDLRISVNHGGNLVAGAKIDIDFKNQWTASFTAPSGVFEGQAWQRGEFAVFVSVPDGAGFSATKSIAGDTRVEWVVAIPDRVVQGRIRERGTGKPIFDAVVVLNRERSKQVVRSDESGAYRFDFQESGPLVIRAILADRYLPGATELILLESDRVRKVDFDLAPAVRTRVKFVMGSGQPAAMAKVYDQTESDVLFRTDEAGEIVLRLREDEVRRVIVVPWRGAFAIVNVASQKQQHEPVIVRLSEGPAKLIISARDEDGQPISGISFEVRYNGEDVPTDVLQWIAARDGNQLSTGVDGKTVLAGMPLGTYELWPVTSARNSRSGIPSSLAPVRFAAHSGENPVTLTFTRW